MKKPHPYQNIIEKKLEQLPTANADLLWNEMHSILDKRMPQKKERRRFIFWFLPSSGILMLAIGLLVIIGSTLFFFSTKESSTVNMKRSHGSVPIDKSTENGTARLSEGGKENITITSSSNQKHNDDISSTLSSIGVVDQLSNNNFVAEQTLKQPEPEKKTALFNQSIPGISNEETNFDLAKLDLRSNQQNFHIQPKQDGQKNSASEQPQSMDYKMKPKRRNNNAKGLYGGITSGVDVSSIHFRSVRQGSTKGLIIGYAFNQKWSIESGLLWDTKRVYDNGTYFNPPGYIPTNGIKITDVNGKSRLHEWPINIKYTVIAGKQSLFASAGLSSYIMRVENYDYLYTQNNQPGGHNYLSYTNETKNWFSVANFSLGYTHRLGDIGNIRIEPYLKLPIKNIGVGKMPIMSYGLNIGFTKTLK